MSKADYIHVQIHCVHHANVFFLSTVNGEHCPLISQGISHADPIACQNSMADSSVTVLKTYPYLVIHIYHTAYFNSYLAYCKYEETGNTLVLCSLP